MSDEFTSGFENYHITQSNTIRAVLHQKLVALFNTWQHTGTGKGPPHLPIRPLGPFQHNVQKPRLGFIIALLCHTPPRAISHFQKKEPSLTRTAL